MRISEITAIQQEINGCLSETNMTRYNPKARSKKDGVKYRFICENIVIAVAGAQPRLGITTFAMRLCHWCNIFPYLPGAMAWSSAGMAGFMRVCSIAEKSRKHWFILL